MLLTSKLKESVHPVENTLSLNQALSDAVYEGAKHDHYYFRHFSYYNDLQPLRNLEDLVHGAIFRAGYVYYWDGRILMVILPELDY